MCDRVEFLLFDLKLCFVSSPLRAAWPFALVMVFSNSAAFWLSFCVFNSQFCQAYK